MVLDKIPGTKIFTQRDVRETSGVTGSPTLGDFTNAQHDHSNAAGGAQLDHTTCFSAGDGTNTHAQIDTHVADATKHFNATTDIDHDTISNNHNLTTDIDHDTLTNFAANEHLDWTGDAGVSNIHVNNITAIPEAAVTAHEAAIDHDALTNFTATEHFTMLDEDLMGTDSNTQAATQQSIKAYVDDHALTNKTSYKSISGIGFNSLNPDTDQIKYGVGAVYPEADGVYFYANVELPQGAVVTGVICYGNAATEEESWNLYRLALSGGAVNIMASQIFNSEDSTISNATVDNETYGYYFFTSSLDTNDRIYGARITYTTDYI